MTISQTLELTRYKAVDWHERLKTGSIDHTSMFSPSVAPRADLNMRLVEDIWQHIQKWAARRLRSVVREECPISVVDGHQMSATGALGVFCLYSNGFCEIKINRTIVDNTDYLLVVLAHEYMHYIHYRTVDGYDYGRCPLVFSEGLAEVGARAFYSASNYRLPKEMRKSWNDSYELGRLIVSQIASEGFGLDGFVRGFVNNIALDCPWRTLDGIFRNT